LTEIGNDGLNRHPGNGEHSSRTPARKTRRDRHHHWGAIAIPDVQQSAAG
jgi:hypothetical protein